MDETQIPADAAFRIQLPTFEGPLDLLLHLIKKHELQILDLPIAFVTARYLDYLQMMQELDLDIASEYLLMAATLAHIKSKMLLPQNPLEEADEHDEAYIGDPREELIRRLLEYQKYRAAAEQLGARPITGRDVFGRGIRTEEAQGPAPLASIDLYKLLDAFGAILKRVKGRVALEVTAERITIHERITEISDLLRARRSCLFEELFAKDRTRYEVVVTFLALLEMTKLRMTRIYQADPKAPIHVQFALLDADSAVPSEAELSADARPAAEPEALAADGGEPLADEPLEQTEPVEQIAEPELADAEFEPADDEPFGDFEPTEPVAEAPELAEDSLEAHDLAPLDAPDAPIDDPSAEFEPAELLADAPEAPSDEPIAAFEPVEPLADAVPDAPELAEASLGAHDPTSLDASDEAPLDARAWDDLNAALEPPEPTPPPAEGGFDDDAATLTNLVPAEPEQPTSDADSTDDNRETSA